MASRRKPIVWTITGSYSGGGAGVQADLLTFHDFSVHGCSVITAISAQNSFTIGQISQTPRRTLAAQINALDSDLYADVIKLGMLGDPEALEMLCKYLADYRGLVVCDPIMSATSGSRLLDEDARQMMIEQLLPRVDVLTPNKAETEMFLGRTVDGLEDVECAAADLVALGARSVLVTGGHFTAHNNQRHDYWTDGVDGYWLSGANIETVNTHGTGCSLSSAIAALLAKGYEIADAMVIAKAYVTQGLRMSVQLGSGPGSIAHVGWPQRLADLPKISRQLPLQAKPQFAACDHSLGLYPVVESSQWVARLLACGVKSIRLNATKLAADTRPQEIAAAVALGERYQAQVFIEDDWREAIAAGAYGVHLGQDTLQEADLDAIATAGLRLGVSSHCYGEVARAHGVAPSYIAVGPIFATNNNESPWLPHGVGQLKRWVALLMPEYPLTASGGVDCKRAAQVLATGVGSCAMSNAIVSAADPEAVTKELIALHESAAC